MGKLDGVQLHLVDSFEEAENFMRWLSEDRNRTWLAVDTETTGLDWWRDRLRLIQVGDARHGWAMAADRWGGLAQEAFTRAKRAKWVGHNRPFDELFLTEAGYELPRLDDTMPAVYLVEPDRPKGLKPASARRIDPRARRGEEQLRQAMQKAKWTWETIPATFDPYWQYAALDTVLTAVLADDVMPIVQEKYADAYALQLESDDVLIDMQRRGIRIDLEYVNKQKNDLDREFEELMGWFKEKYDLDPLSPQQLVRFFWSEGVEIKLETARGEPSVRKESLEQIDHPLVPKILRARKCQKMATAFFGNMLEYARDDLLHPNVNPLGAITGRMSITRPALQTQPRSKLVRDSFIPRDGNKLILADWGAQELRVFAAFCRDAEMLGAFERGEDLHNFTAAAIFGPEFTTAQRRIAKSAGFAKIYGAGVAKFAKTCGISVDEGQAFLDRYDTLFPNAKLFQHLVVQTVMERAQELESSSGYITTLAGRRVPVPRSKAYVGVNYIIQGSCSDILRLALVNLDRAGLGEYIVLPVHDELAFDVPIDLTDDVAVEASEIMQASKFNLDVPMVVEPVIVDRWGEKYD